MTFKINGVDITPYMRFEGLKYTTFDLDSDEAGRTLDGNLRRSSIATKVRWDVPRSPLRWSELTNLMEILSPEWVTLEADDPLFGHRTSTFYTNNNSISIKISSVDQDEELWDGLTFPLIER